MTLFTFTFSEASALLPGLHILYLDPYNLLIPVRGGTFCEFALNSLFTLENWIQATELFNHF